MCPSEASGGYWSMPTIPLPILLLASAAFAAEPSFKCSAPRFEAGMASALRQVRALSPEEAAVKLAELKAVKGADGADGRLGYGSFLAVRAAGLAPESGVYCDEAPDAGDPLGDRWIGVTAEGGRRFRLDLAGTARPDPSDIQEMGALDEPGGFSLASFSGDGAFSSLWGAFKRKLMGLAGRPYVFGGTDCAWLPHAALNSLPGMCSRARSYFDKDSACFTRCDQGPYLPGDLILMGRAEPDHWVVLSEVNDQSRANSPRNKIIDQSSDCGGFCGEGAVRPNLAERRVYACARPKALAEAHAADGASRSARQPLIESSRADRIVAASLETAVSLAP